MAVILGHKVGCLAIPSDLLPLKHKLGSGARKLSSSKSPPCCTPKSLKEEDSEVGSTMPLQIATIAQSEKGCIKPVSP